MMKYIERPINIDEAKQNLKILQQLEDSKDLLDLIQAEENLLDKKINLKRYYHCFKIPKKNNKFRKIEAPKKPLKKVQRKLNLLLQSAYITEIPENVHGFVYNFPEIPDKKKRNILNNAKYHCKSKRLFNIDLKDFFHQIKSDKIFESLCAAPFKLQTKIALEITRMCTLNMRLPMGAPTSPVLSNIVLKKLDEELASWSKEKKLKYSRYADDLTFSGKRKPTLEDYAELQIHLQTHGLSINPKKFRYYGKRKAKEITGILINEKDIDVSPTFKMNLENGLRWLSGIARWKQISTMYNLPTEQTNSKGVKFYRQSLKGQLAFLGFVKGKNDPEYLLYRKKYRDASAGGSRFYPAVY